MVARKVSIVRYEYLTIPELAVELGRRARDFRLRKRLEQAEVAELAGITRQTLSTFEQGKGSSVETLLKVMKALKVSDNLDNLFPAAPTIDPMAVLMGEASIQRVSKKRRSRG